MRKFLLLPAVLLMSLSASAFFEGANNELVTGTTLPGVGGLFPHFNPNAGAGTTVPTTNLRLIAKANHSYKDAGFVAFDSIRYEYGSGRGSVPDNERLTEDDYILFDLSTKYVFSASLWGYERAEQREQYFTNDNKVSQLIYKNWHAINNDWKNSEKYTYTYDAAGKMEKSLLQLWYGALWTNDINSTLSYDLNNNVTNMQALTYRVSFNYNASNNLVSMEDQIWSQGNWVNSERKTYNYTASNLTEYILEQWSGSAWVNSKRLTYVYSGNNIVQSTEYTWNGAWLPDAQHDFSYDGSDNMLEDVKKVWNSSSAAFENDAREVRMYNYKLLPSSVTTYSWNGQDWVFAAGDTKTNFYYEEFVPSSVPDAFIAQKMDIYPIPAKDNLTITMKWERPEAFTVSIMDMGGRVVMQEQEQAVSDYKRTIPVAQLPAGNYAVLVASSSARVMKKIVVTE